MWRGGRLAWAVLLCVLLSGCTSWPLHVLEGPAEDRAPPQPPTAEALERSSSGGGAYDALHTALAAPRERPLALELDVSPGWTKPRNVVEISLASSDAGTPASAELAWRWFVGTNGSNVRVHNASGMYFLQGGTGEGTSTRAAPSGTPGLDTGLIPPGATSLTIEFPQPARYEFAAPRHPSVAFNLTVLPDAAAAVDLTVALVEDEHGFRFAPDEAHVGPGSRVRFANRDVAAHAVLEARYWALVPWNSPSLVVVGVDTGWYEVLALATAPHVEAPGGTSTAREAHGALLVDFGSPAPRGRAGPFSDRLLALSGAESASFPLTASRDVRLLELDVELDTPAGVGDAAAPPTLEVALRRVPDDGAEAADVERFELDKGARIAVEDLPAGDYRVEVRLVEGALADVEVEAFLRYDVQPPTPPAWMHPDAATR